MDACLALGKACAFVGDFDDARRYYERAVEGYEEHLGRDSEKALDAMCSLVSVNTYNGQRITSEGKKIEFTENC